MAQFRTTADLIDDILERSGEVTNGNSPYEASALRYINRVHQTIISGGNEFNLDVDEPWKWAVAKDPIIIELQPKFDTDSVSLTNGSTVGTFLTAPTDSLKGWYLRLDSRDDIFRIASHTAGATAFTLDSNYTQDTGGALIYKAFKLDYEVIQTHIIIDQLTDKLEFEETAASILTATLTQKSYTPAELATELKTQLDAAGASTYTVTFNADTRKFDLSSDRTGGGNIFTLKLVTAALPNRSVLPTLGFDDLDVANAASHVSIYILSGISRLIAPFVIYSGINRKGNVTSMDSLAQQKREPLMNVVEGVPDNFAQIRTDDEGRVFVRFSHYPNRTMRVELPYIPVPRDLQDNVVSVPLLPRKFNDVLEYGASSYVLLDKEDSKAVGFSQLAGTKLNAMLIQNRGTEQRAGENFGTVIPRPEQLPRSRRKFLFGEPEDA